MCVCVTVMRVCVSDYEWASEHMLPLSLHLGVRACVYMPPFSCTLMLVYVCVHAHLCMTVSVHMPL